MRLNSVVLQNFRQHLDTRIDFDTGLTGIIGPNGSGKSTILEAIAWALYGTPAARGNRQTIRSLRAPARAQVKVELDFELGGHRYHVVRGLTSAELYLDGADAPIANTLSGVTDLLQRRLGMSQHEFFNTYFTGQKELSVMAAMGPTERAQFLSRVLGYEKLRTAQGLVRERRRIILAETTGLRAGMPDPDQVERAFAEAEARVASSAKRLRETQERRASARAAVDAVAPRWETMQREREAQQKIVNEIRVAEGEHASLVRDSERIAREVQSIAGARAELERIRGELQPLPDLRVQLQQMDVLLREEGRRQTLVETERALADELLRLRDRRSKVEAAPTLEREAALELEAKRVELEQAQTALDSARTEWVRDKQEAETKRGELARQWEDMRHQREQLVRLGEEGICPTCQRPLGSHYRTVLDLVDSQIETVEVDGKYFKSRMEQLADMPAEVKELEERRRGGQEQVAKLERRLTKVQLAIQEIAQLDREITLKIQRQEAIQRDLAGIPVGYDGARHRELRATVERLQPLDAMAARLSAQVEREALLRQEHERASDSLARASARIASLAAQRDAITFSENAFQSLRTSFEQATYALREAELHAVSAESDATSATAARDVAARAKAELEKSKAQLEALTRDKRLHDELDRAYSDMRNDLNVQLRPEISELASSFLSDLTDGRYSELELDDQYNIIVLEDGVPKPVISGGEEDIANLVLRLAISQMIAERAGQPFSLLVLDEVFGSLDEARRNNVVDLLRRLHDRFEQVILITHIEPVREGLDRVMTVRYDEEAGASRVERETPGDAVDLDAEDVVEAGAAD